MKETIKAISFGLVFGFAIFVAADYAFSIPDVTFSYSTNDCVKVENYPSTFFGTSQYSCELLPNKYNHIWVK